MNTQQTLMHPTLLRLGATDTSEGKVQALPALEKTALPLPSCFSTWGWVRTYESPLLKHWSSLQKKNWLGQLPFGVSIHCWVRPVSIHVYMDFPQQKPSIVQGLANVQMFHITQLKRGSNSSPPDNVQNPSKSPIAGTWIPTLVVGYPHPNPLTIYKPYINHH